MHRKGTKKKALFRRSSMAFADIVEKRLDNFIGVCYNIEEDDFDKTDSPLILPIVFYSAAGDHWRTIFTLFYMKGQKNEC